MMSEFLCETGLKFYHQGRYDEALTEFKKALMVEPSYGPALRYIQMIEQTGVTAAAPVPVTFQPAVPSAGRGIDETLEIIEIQKEMAERVKLTEPRIAAVEKKKKISAPKLLILDETLARVPQPVDIQQGEVIVVAGENIERFLVTQPDIITVQRKDNDELLITGKDIGYTYLYVWDNNGRWETEWLGIFPKPEGPTYEELMRQEEQRARNFRLRYTLDWSSFETGRRTDALNRTSYSWSHGLTLIGPTPYGDIDSSASIRRVRTSSDLTYFTLGLTNGRIGPFKDFTLRTFDYNPPFSNLAFSGATMRGAMLSSPAFNDKLAYTGFWGREGGGRYGNLSPSLAKTKHSFVDGVNLNYSPNEIQDYKFTLAHGWGRDRETHLNSYDYDFGTNFNLDNWGWGYEIANDTETFAHLLNSRYTQPNLNFTAELRNISRNFNTITDRAWRAGEIGGLFNLSCKPTEKLGMRSSLDVYRDRLFPAPDNDRRLNEDFNWDANYQVGPQTALSLNYTLQNDLGKVSQYRYQSPGLGLSKSFKLIREVSSYINYYYQNSKNYSSPNSDYINDRIYAGLRFNLIGELYYYINKEINWLQERYYSSSSTPHALETGLNWSSQLGKTPFHGNCRFTYRDEENTVSNLTFLSGEDYVEGYTELSYRPTNDKEIYGSYHAKNIWAENPSASKRIDVDFSAGMRYLWDTGLRWESVSDIEGYIFKDSNSDGLRQRDEPPVEGITVWLGKNKSQASDLFGYYKFKNVRAQKAYVNLDTSTLPAGFVLTVPATQELSITHHVNARVDFGIISLSEISGFVFEDVNGNGEYDRGDKGIRGVIITLENRKEVTTDDMGRYSFSNASAGEHTLALDLNSLPVYFLPEAAITKEITLFEGVTYIYNIPLKRIKE